MISQKFGGKHTERKLTAISDYLPAYTTALSGQNFNLHYIDAFAGTGLCTVSINGRETLIPGSASIAVNCMPSFDSLTFIEKIKNKCKALQRLADGSPSLNIKVLHGDANYFVVQSVNALKNWNDRAILFLDPFGMEVDWNTLKVAAESKKVDVWYLFSLSGLYRQAAIDPSSITKEKENAINRALGTNEWRQAFYSKPEPSRTNGDLFLNELIEECEKAPERRTHGAEDILAWVEKRFNTIFSYVHPPEILYQEGRNIPMFALFYMMANDSGKAIGLGKKIVASIFEKVRKKSELGTPPTRGL